MRAVIIILALLVTTGTGWADIVGTWKTGNDQTLKVSYRDTNHIRMDVGAEGYMLVSDEKVYMVTRSDGKWTAMDMDEMAGMMKLFGQKAPDKTGRSVGETRFETTGRKETIAGYEGEVYRVIYTDSSGKASEQEVVLSNHPDVKELNQSWIALASRMAQIMDRNAADELKHATQAAREQGIGGMLRSGEDMILQNLKRTSLKASHYKLPKGVQMVAMPDMGSGQGYRRASQPSAVQEAGEEDFVSESAREISKTAQDEATESAKDSVRKAIRSLW